MPAEFSRERGQLIRQTQVSLTEGVEGLSKIGDQLAELKQVMIEGASSQCTCFESLSEAVAHIEALNEQTKGYLEKAQELSELLVGEFSHDVYQSHEKYESVMPAFRNAKVLPTDLLPSRYGAISRSSLQAKTYGDLICYSENELRANCSQMGHKNIEKLEQHLSEVGLHLRQD